MNKGDGIPLFVVANQTKQVLIFAVNKVPFRLPNRLYLHKKGSKIIVEAKDGRLIGHLSAEAEPVLSARSDFFFSLTMVGYLRVAHPVFIIWKHDHD